MTVNVEDLTRDQLEQTVMSQQEKINTLLRIIQGQKASYVTLENQYEELGGIMIAARKLLS